MSDTSLGPLAALVGPAAAPVAHWLQLIKLADTESVRRVCQSQGRGATTRTANRVIRELVDCGLATSARRQHTSRVVVATGAVISPRTLAHDLIVSRVSAIALQCGWWWERDVAGRNEHLADGILSDAAGRRVGVEIEMTRKTIARTRQILAGHGQVSHRYSSALYIGTTDTMGYINRIAADTGTAGVLSGTVAAVEHWTHDIDNDALTAALTALPGSVAAAPMQQQLAFGDQPHQQPPSPTATARPAAAAGPVETGARSSRTHRAVTDAEILDVRTRLDPNRLTAADRTAAAALFAQQLTRAEVTNNTAAADRIRRRQQELGLV
jgi:hypothetical protein